MEGLPFGLIDIDQNRIPETLSAIAQLPWGTLVQDIAVANTTDSPRTVQAFFAARLSDNTLHPLLGPVPQAGRKIAGNSSFERTLNCPFPAGAPSPYIVGFLSILLDYEIGDTLDIEETWVMITEMEGMDTENGDGSRDRAWD